MVGGVGRLGVGLWTFQSTAARPVNLTSAYRRFSAQAELLEELGFHSAWTAEHRLWYDGWCPAILHAHAAAAAATSRLRFGTAMLIAPQHNPHWLLRNAVTLQRLSRGRVDLGLGLGHRDAEFDAMGLRRDRRGAMMEDCLSTFEGQRGSVVAETVPPIWMGGISQRSLTRAAAWGHRIMLPQTVLASELPMLIESYRQQTRDGGVVGVMRDVWVEPDETAVEHFRRRMHRHYAEEVGAWWVLRGGVGFTQPEQMKRQLERVLDAALIGDGIHVANGLNALFAAGADLVLIRSLFDFVGPEELEDQLLRVARDVGPRLTPGRTVL